MLKNRVGLKSVIKREKIKNISEYVAFSKNLEVIPEEFDKNFPYIREEFSKEPVRIWKNLCWARLIKLYKLYILSYNIRKNIKK